MSRAIALTQRAYAQALRRQADALGSAIVIGCGAALILAGRAHPF